MPPKVKHKVVSGIEVKRCGRCKEWKSLELFYNNPAKWDRLTCYCKRCHNKGTLRYSENNREKVRASARRNYLRRKYGLTPEEYEQLLIKQNGCCAICREKLDRGQHTHVDHNHKTRAVRGLLCQKCNHAVGDVREDPGIAEKLKQYLIDACGR